MVQLRRQGILMVECINDIGSMLDVDENANVHMLWQVGNAVIFSGNLKDFQ